MPVAAAYCRVSTAAQADDGLSLAEQEKQLRKRAEADGYEVRFYVERAASGRSLRKRPKLAQLIADAKAGQFAVVMVSRLDRLGRNNRDLHNLIGELEEAGAKFVCLNPEIDTATSQGRLYLGITASVAENESNMIAERVKPILRSNAEAGKHHARPPFGYAVENKRLIPHPEQAYVVQRIFRERSAGATQRAIARALNAEGVKTATGASWDPSNLGKILSNRKYIGEVELNGEVFPGQHEPIIDAELWAAVEGLRDANREVAGKGRGRVPSRHLFVRGHLRCGLCGAAMLPRTHGKREYYLCSNRRDKGAEACTMDNVPRRELDEAAWAYFSSVGIDLEATRERQHDAQVEKAAALKAQLNAAKAAVKQAEAKHRRVKDQVAAGEVTQVEWQEEWRDELEAGILDAKAHVSKVELEQDAPPPSDDFPEVRDRLDAIRAAVAGDMESPESIEAARAGIRRMFESFTIAPVPEAYEQTALEREVAEAQAAEFIDNDVVVPLVQAGERRKWLVSPEPRLEVLYGQHPDAHGSDIAYRPVLQEAPLPLGDNGSEGIDADTVQFLESAGNREDGEPGENGDGELIGAGAREDDLSF